MRRSPALGFVLVGIILFAAACGESPNSVTAPSPLTSDLSAHPSGNVTLPNPTITADVSTCEHVTLSWTNIAVTGHVAQRWHIQLDDAPDFASVLFNDAQYS